MSTEGAARGGGGDGGGGSGGGGSSAHRSSSGPVLSVSCSAERRPEMASFESTSSACVIDVIIMIEKKSPMRFIRDSSTLPSLSKTTCATSATARSRSDVSSHDTLTGGGTHSVAGQPRGWRAARGGGCSSGGGGGSRGGSSGWTHQGLSGSSRRCSPLPACSLRTRGSCARYGAHTERGAPRVPSQGRVGGQSDRRRAAAPWGLGLSVPASREQRPPTGTTSSSD